MHRARRTRNHRSKRGGMIYTNKIKDDILINKIKEHIIQKNGELPNFNNIFDRALNNPALNEATRSGPYEYKVKEWLKYNYDSNGNAIQRTPYIATNESMSEDDDSDEEDDPFKGGKLRHLRHANKKSRKVRKSRKSRKSRYSGCRN